MSHIDNYRIAARSLHNLEHRSRGTLFVVMQRSQQGRSVLKYSTSMELQEDSPEMTAFIDALRCRVTALRVKAEQEAKELLAEECAK